MYRSMFFMLLIVSFALGISSCHSFHGTRISDAGLRNAARNLDFVSSSIDQFGTVSISGTSMIEPDPEFQLDLELTGKQIFERNRIEGFSSSRQTLAIDAQLSVTAEITQNLLGELNQTTDPGLRSILKDKIRSAALAGIIQSLPEEQQAIFDGVIEASQSNVPGNSASDGGQGAIESAAASNTAAQGHYASVTDLIAQIDAATTDEEKITKGNAAAAAVEQGLNGELQVVQRVQEAAKRAMNLVLDAERSAIGNAGASGTPQSTVDNISAAKTNAKTAQDLANDFLGKVSERNTTLKPGEALKDVAAADVSAKITALQTGATADYRDAEPKKIQGLIAEGEKAVNTARSLATATGTQIAPKQKILEAPKIAVADRLAKAALPGFSDPLDNYEGPLDLNLRQLILLTAADKATLEMSKWLSYPRDAGPGKKVFLCMATVNVTPGRDTYFGYMGQVDVYIEYGRANESGANREAIRFPGQHPISVAVHPLIDSQVLDLRTSRRQMFTMAFQAIVNGFPAAANAFLDVAKQLEQDVETVTGINTMTSYSTGSHFGFTFSPKLVAQDNPASINAKPKMMLQPQTIPVMIMITCDENQLASADNPYGATDLQWMQTYQWHRAGQPRYDRYPGGSWISRIRNPRLSEYEFLARADALDKALDHLGTLRVHDRYQQSNLIPDLVRLYQRSENQLGKAVSINAEKQSTRIDSDLAAWLKSELERQRQLIGGSGWSYDSLQEDVSTVQEALDPIQEPEFHELRMTIARIGRLITPGSSGISPTFVDQVLQTRANALSSAGIGTKIYFKLPLYGTDRAGGSGTGGTPGFREDPDGDGMPGKAPTLAVSPATGWMNRPSILFVSADQTNAFKDDFSVTVGGRSVTASRISNRVLRVVVPQWLGEASLTDALEALKDDNLPGNANLEPKLTADVVVATANGVLTAKPQVEFLYFAPDIETPDITAHTVTKTNKRLSKSKPADEEPKDTNEAAGESGKDPAGQPEETEPDTGSNTEGTQ